MDMLVEERVSVCTLGSSTRYVAFLSVTRLVALWTRRCGVPSIHYLISGI